MGGQIISGQNVGGVLDDAFAGPKSTDEAGDASLATQSAALMPEQSGVGIGSQPDEQAAEAIRNLAEGFGAPESGAAPNPVATIPHPQLGVPVHLFERNFDAQTGALLSGYQAPKLGRVVKNTDGTRVIDVRIGGETESAVTSHDVPHLDAVADIQAADAPNFWDFITSP